MTAIGAEAHPNSLDSGRQLIELSEPGRVINELRSSWPEPELGPVDVASVERHWTSFVPDRSAVAVFRVTARTAGIQFHTFAVVDVAPGRTRWSTALHDAQLTELALLLGRDGRRIDHVLPGEGHTVVPVRYRPGRRCTMHVSTGSGEYFAKVLVSGADRQRRLLGALSANLGRPARAAPLLSPGASNRIVVSERIPGEGAWGIIKSDRHPLPVRCRIAAGVGAALADLHATAVDPALLPRSEGDLAEISLALRSADAFQPDSGHTARRILAGFVPQVAAGVGPDRAGDELALCHGSFRFDQVLCGPAGPTILDFDAACHAPPELDLGNALAYLDWRCIRQPEAAPGLRAVADAFLDGYEDAAAPIDRRRLAAHHAVACVKIGCRRFTNLDLDEWPLVPELLAWAGELRSIGGGG